MPVQVGARRRVTATLFWPVGLAWTSWHYIWRILPVHRQEEAGNLPDDLPPPLPDSVSLEEVRQPQDGVGPLLHRRYWCQIADAQIGAHELISRLAADPNLIAPRQIARFSKARGEEGQMEPGDEFLVHMPGPWNGPVRTVEVRPDRFRFATLAGHLEAGQIEWRAWEEDGKLYMSVESWARGADRLSAILHDRLRMAKEVQLYMWTTVLQGVPRLTGGHLRDGVHVHTRRVPPEAFEADRVAQPA
ncbi:MAG TPA: hypothetical protein VG405_07845 [Solirubrobacteraceae bacterium]|jgi:hypothetical protein|nr:hypothetical protein [Solirubrobacteraceae bacterium]